MPQGSKYYDTYIKQEETETGRLTYLAEITQLDGGWNSDIGCACKNCHFFLKMNGFLFLKENRICHLFHVYEKENFQ